MRFSVLCQSAKHGSVHTQQNHLSKQKKVPVTLVLGFVHVFYLVIHAPSLSSWLCHVILSCASPVLVSCSDWLPCFMRHILFGCFISSVSSLVYRLNYSHLYLVSLQTLFMSVCICIQPLCFHCALSLLITLVSLCFNVWSSHCLVLFICIYSCLLK